MFKLTLISLVLLFHTALASTQSQHAWQAVLVESWPRTSCCKWDAKTRSSACSNCHSKSNTWTIHGLWPGWQDDAEQLGYCMRDAGKVNENVLRQNRLYADMSRVWYSTNGNVENVAFWNHEWRKHGACALSRFANMSSYVNYFDKTLRLYERYNVGAYLGSLKNGAVYTFDQLYNTIWSRLNHRYPVISCHRIGNDQYISEVEICFDTRFNLIDCTHRYYVQNGEHIYRRSIGCQENKPVVYA